MRRSIIAAVASLAVVALGATRQTIDIAGTTTQTSPGLAPVNTALVLGVRLKIDF